MTTIPKFALYGTDDPQIEEAIQPSLALRRWADLSKSDKEIVFQQLLNNQVIDDNSAECSATIRYLNHTYLRQLPGKRWHKAENEAYHLRQAAFADFKDILLKEKSEALVLRMLSKLAECYIDGSYLQMASKVDDDTRRKQYVSDAFAKFDSVARCLNHIFNQFAVNQVVTRSGFIPRQDKKNRSDLRSDFKRSGRS